MLDDPSQARQDGVALRQTARGPGGGADHAASGSRATLSGTWEGFWEPWHYGYESNPRKRQALARYDQGSWEPLNASKHIVLDLLVQVAHRLTLCPTLRTASRGSIV
jgi:hypothetical protein